MNITKAQDKFREQFFKLRRKYGTLKATALMSFWLADALDDIDLAEEIKQQFKTLKSTTKGV